MGQKIRQAMISYTNEVLGAYSGQTNCEAGIYVNDEIVGVVQYVLYQGELTISDIFIRPEFRRKGYGSRLMKYIREINPSYKYKPSLKTELGAAFKHKDLPLEESKRAKFVYESIENVLKPKSKEDVLNVMRTTSDYELLSKKVDEAPTLTEYIKTFVLEKSLWTKDPNHPEYEECVINKTDANRFEYKICDVTELAKERILSLTRKMGSPDKLKIIETTAGLNSDPMVKFMYMMNKYNTTESIKSRNDNDIFQYQFVGLSFFGAEYAFFGSGNGWAIFVISPEFLDHAFGINEGAESVLKPKAKEEFYDSMMELFKTNFITGKEMLEGLDLSIEENRILKKDTLGVCENMEIPIENLRIIVDEEPEYESIETLFSLLVKEFDEDKHITFKSRYTGGTISSSGNYYMYLNSKICFFNESFGLSAILFDMDHVLNLVKTWGSINESDVFKPKSKEDVLKEASFKDQLNYAIRYGTIEDINNPGLPLIAKIYLYIKYFGKRFEFINNGIAYHSTKDPRERIISECGELNFRYNFYNINVCQYNGENVVVRILDVDIKFVKTIDEFLDYVKKGVKRATYLRNKE